MEKQPSLPSYGVIYNTIGLVFGGLTGLVISENWIGLVLGLAIGLLLALFFHNVLAKR